MGCDHRQLSAAVLGPARDLEEKPGSPFLDFHDILAYSHSHENFCALLRV
jgi:hypothetical protein